MRKSIRILAVLLSLLLLCGCGKKETKVTVPVDEVIVTVNGQQIRQSEYSPYRTEYMIQYANMGMDMTDKEAVAYVEDLALSACIQDVLVDQDAIAQGCHEIDEENARWLIEAGTAAYEQALLDAGEYLRQTLELDAETDMTQAALAYAAELGVTPESYIQVYRDQFLTSLYYGWLLKDCPITDADIQAEYDARVAADKALYENDAAAFETALVSGEEVWYQPEGYRSVLQILLPAKGETDEEKLASVQEIVGLIYKTLDAGASFESLIAEYGTDGNFADPDFLTTGYSVHPDSIIWDKAFIAAAFSDELTAPGSYTKTPMVTQSGVHILYYLKDSEGGPVPLTDTLKEALSYTLYQQRVNTRLAERLEELSNSAVVEYAQ